MWYVCVGGIAQSLASEAPPELCYTEDGMNQVWGPVAGIIPSRYTSLTSLRFTVQWIYASLVAHLYLLYEDTRTRMRYPLLSFSCTLLVTEEPGSAIAAHSLVLLDPRRLARAV